MRVIFLGTNGWFTTETGNTTCLLIDTDDFAIICDAGNGIRLLDEHISSFDKPVYLFMSHFHMDHISGLHILNKFNFKQGLKIICYPAGAEILHQIIRQPYTIAFKDLKFPVEIIEIDEGRHSFQGFVVECADLIHSTRVFGYRFELEDKSIAFCTDTGECDNLLRLAREADLLITECAYLPGMEVKSWPHLNPETCAKVAKEAGAKKLAMMHFDAHLYHSLELRKDALIKAKKIYEEIILPEDGLVVNV